jgi:hypothetical protein
MCQNTTSNFLCLGDGFSLSQNLTVRIFSSHFFPITIVTSKFDFVIGVITFPSQQSPVPPVDVSIYTTDSNEHHKPY